MVNAAGAGGGPALLDRNLVEAYDDLAWYRYLSVGMAQASGSEVPDDPAMTLLNPLDWNKDTVDSAVDSVIKAKQDADGAHDELSRLKSDVTAAWKDNTLESLVQASVGALEEDYQAFSDELSRMRKHLEQHVFDGMKDATGAVKIVTERLKTQYGYLAKLHTLPSPHDHKKVDGQHTQWQIAQHAVHDANDELDRAVAAAKDQIVKLSDCVTSDKHPVDMTYGPPPGASQG